MLTTQYMEVNGISLPSPNLLNLPPKIYLVENQSDILLHQMIIAVTFYNTNHKIYAENLSHHYQKFPCVTSDPTNHNTLYFISQFPNIEISLPNTLFWLGNKEILVRKFPNIEYETVRIEREEIEFSEMKVRLGKEFSKLDLRWLFKRCFLTKEEKFEEIKNKVWENQWKYRGAKTDTIKWIWGISATNAGNYSKLVDTLIEDK